MLLHKTAPGVSRLHCMNCWRVKKALFFSYITYPLENALVFPSLSSLKLALPKIVLRSRSLSPRLDEGLQVADHKAG